MLQPGLEVFHIPDIDYRSGCMTFRRCLKEIDTWSRAHPGHLPIMTTINAADTPSGRAGISDPLPLTAPLLRGRPIFGWYDPATPEGAMQIVQDPLVNGAKIRDGVRQGVIVRTRSDLPTTDARTGSHARGGERSAGGQHR